MDDPSNMQNALNGLKSNDPEKRRIAAQTLGKLGSPRAIDPLIEALRDRNDAQLRAYAVEALGKIVERSQSGFSSNGSGESSTAEVLSILGKLNQTRLTTPIQIALRDPDAEVRRCAAIALGKTGDYHAVNNLGVALQDADDRVKQAAAEALSAIGGDEAVNLLARWWTGTAGSY